MAARFWVGGAGTWDNSATTHWSATSGGASGASAPTSSDTVTFDVNSGLNSGGNVTIAATAVCGGCTASGFTNTSLVPVGFVLSGNPTWSAGTYSFVGSGQGATFQIVSSVTGTTRTLTINGTHGTHTDLFFNDITIAGTAGTLTGTRLSDGLGNSGITFTTAATQTFVGGTKNYNDPTAWTSRVPLAQDDVVINTTTAGTLTANTFVLGKNVDFTSFTRTFTMTRGCLVFGNLTLSASGMAFTSAAQTLTLWGRGSHTFTTNGVQIGVNLAITAFGGTYTLQDNYTSLSTRSITLTDGTFDTTNKNVTTANFVGSASTTRALTMGTGTWTLAGTGGLLWTVGAPAVGMTLSAASSTITFTDTTAAHTFAGGGLSYGTFQFTAAGAFGLTITGSNTFGTLTLTCTTARTITLPANGTQTVTSAATFQGAAGQNLTLQSSSGGTTTIVVISQGCVLTTANLTRTSDVSFQFPRTGSVISGGSALSGPDVLTVAETGAATSEGKASAAEQATFNRTGSAVSDLDASGADVATFNRTGKAVSDLDAAGGDAYTPSETGKAVSELAASAADVFTPAETGAATSDLNPFGAEALSVQESGSVVSDLDARAADVLAVAETGAAVSDLSPSGADAATSAETGAALSDLNASGADVMMASETGKAISDANASGADALTRAESGFVKLGGEPATTVDDFSGADGVLPGPWVALESQAGTMALRRVGGRLAHSISGANATSWASAYRGDLRVSGGHSVSVTLVDIDPAEGQIALWAFVDNVGAGAWTGYALYVAGDGSWLLSRFDLLGGEDLASAGPSLPQLGDVITLEVSGSTIRGLLNGVAILSAEDTTYRSGFPGVGIYRTAPATEELLDDFTVVYARPGVVLSGLDVFTPAESGAAASDLDASGVDAAVAAESGTAASDLNLAGTDAATFAESGRPEAEAVASGADAQTVSESGSAASEAAASAADVFAPSESGASVSDLNASGADSFQHAEAGHVESDRDLTGADVFQSVNSGNVVADFLLSGADTFTATERGSGISTVTISGPADVVVYRFLPGKTIIGSARLVVAEGRARLVLGEGDARLVVAAGRARLVAPESPARQPEADSQAVRR